MKFIIVCLVVLLYVSTASNRCPLPDSQELVFHRQACMEQECSGSNDLFCVPKCSSAKLNISTECFPCFSPLISCSLTACDANNDPLCIELKCLPIYHVCASGACTNPSDSDKLKNLTLAKADMDTCGRGCYGSSTFSTCVAQCMSSKLGISSSCAQCFGDDGECTKDNCLLQCINPDSQSCLDCSNQYCTPAFTSCSGIA